MKKSEEMKERIIRATTELIDEGNGRAEEITTRMIADKTGIGVGLIHYHFQTKERLLEQCVQRMIGGVIARFEPSGSGTLGGLEALKSVAKEVADFLMVNASISRISILGDLNAPALDDNTAKTMRGFAMAFSRGSTHVTSKQEAADELPSTLFRARLFTLTAMLQAAFLRRDISGELFGWDVRIKEERDRYIDWLIEQLFAKEEGR
ncbi:TetR/AcrR family transcriptional regulator [Gorillibacterium timonense]|uniref:TetR/AcrR family transcriptional regulator n=1 Tax=Gorillibacterium timonense TaxID=1689269 RepID=UPI00071DB9B1|nr:TetR/AcrR family transcriptional regulator [Gorillibacterium timonense]